jgi:hypothetical protein
MSENSRSTTQQELASSKVKAHYLLSIWPIKKLKQEQVSSPKNLGENDALPPSRRLVVVLPDAPLDIFKLSKRIWSLAVPEGRQVVLLSQPDQKEDEAHLRMNLSSLAALIRDTRVKVQTHLASEVSLEQAALQVSEPGDIFICFEEHCISGFLKSVRVADVLAEKVQMPIYTLKGSISDTNPQFFEYLVDSFLLVVSLASLAGFVVLSIWIVQNSSGVVQTLMQILAMCAEAWFLAVCAKRSFKI